VLVSACGVFVALLDQTLDVLDFDFVFLAPFAARFVARARAAVLRAQGLV
jgi:hypothetical protein